MQPQNPNPPLRQPNRDPRVQAAPAPQPLPAASADTTPTTDTTDLLSAAREIMAFLGEMRGKIRSILELIRLYRTGGFLAVLNSLDNLLSEWAT